MKPRMIRAGDELWSDVLAEAQERDEDIAEATRRFWLRYTAKRRKAREAAGS